MLGTIEQLGFVQIDSIDTVVRAHHMIIAARRKSYRPRHLAPLLERRRELFEHWTHDASVIPTAYFPHWRLRFERDRQRLIERWRAWRRGGFETHLDDILERIREDGPIMARDVGPADAGTAGVGSTGGHKVRGSDGWWDWKPSKTALEYLWRTGALAVTARQGFQKVFDLTERAIPADILSIRSTEADTVDWAARTALDRLGFATSGEIAGFWETISPAEAKAWVAGRLGDGLIEIDVEGADGSVKRMFAWADIADAAAEAPAAPGGVRVLSPFDPLLRNRKRAD